MLLKIAQIARMRTAGIKDVQIARALNITNSGLQRILRTHEYIDYEEAYFQGHLSKMDEKMAGKIDLLNRHMRAAVPMALRTIMDVAMQRKDLKSALAASKEILDRDPDRTFNADVTHDAPGAGLPTALFESLVKDADGVAVAVKKKLDEKSLQKADA